MEIHKITYVNYIHISHTLHTFHTSFTLSLMCVCPGFKSRLGHADFSLHVACDPLLCPDITLVVGEGVKHRFLLLLPFFALSLSTLILLPLPLLFPSLYPSFSPMCPLMTVDASNPHHVTNTQAQQGQINPSCKESVDLVHVCLISPSKDRPGRPTRGLSLSRRGVDQERIRRAAF